MMTRPAILDFSAEQLAKARAQSQDYQSRAADPGNSAWVSANAGTGKTYVLVLRVLRLLLSGASIDSLLCLTFTKAAAAEMSNRLIARLGEWAAMSEAALCAELTVVLKRDPTSEECSFARCLFAHVLDAPGGLKIMTIHAFCDRVLRRFPIEAGVPPSFTILTDEERRALLQETTDTVLHEAAQHGECALGKALTTVVSHAGEDRFQELLQAVIGKQDAIRQLIREQIDGDDPFEGIEAALRVALGARCDETPETIIAEMAATCPDALIASAVSLLNEGKKSDWDLADRLGKARGKVDRARVEALTTAFLTAAGQRRADRGFVTKALRESDPGTSEALCRARDDFAALEVRRRALDAATASTALLRLGDAVIQLYEETKAQRTAMDFDGLIAKTAALFQRSGASAWVLFRLDSDLRHILVDEAQDTSPAQWALVRALTTEFFSGEGVDDRTDTLFAVGDEKQSIYGFQGADPRQFAETGRDYSQRARAARQPWIEAPLTLSYRTTRAVLEAVDLVFADRERTAGLTADGSPVRHFANREGEAGLVEVWPVVTPEKRDAAAAWEPFSENAGAPPPPKMLAGKIAKQIRHWLDSGEMLTSQNRPVRPGDILILVRKRNPLAAPLVKALKAQGVPVAGADRMKLTEQLAVMDLMALGDALLLPEDDLTLAALLKSPVFGFDDDDLFAVGHGRSLSLWDALAEKRDARPAYAATSDALNNWREAAAAQKPFDFYMARLEGDGLRRKLLDRLGPEAADAIDEFVNLALAYEASETPTLQGFLHWLRAAAPEIKRDMEGGRDEVRVMTVHGSKGLEANIVILADTCSARSGGRGGLVELDQPGRPPDAATLPVWVLPGSRLVPAIDTACADQQRAEQEEYLRLLYVAMTRARDRLYVGGFEGLKARDRNCWYDLVCDGLQGRLSEALDHEGKPVQRMECAQEIAPKQPPAIGETRTPAPMPEWSAGTAVAALPPRMISPSRLDVSATGASAHPGARPRFEALQRGRLVHRLLELLPLLPVSRREARGAAFLSAEARTISKRERDRILADVVDILGHRDFGPLFGPGSRAEAPIAAELPPPDAGAPPLLISGQIDRLIVRAADVLILDFKTGPAVPRDPSATPPAYLAQLAAYRLAIARLFPGRDVRAALLWTEKPQLMPIPTGLLDHGERLLYESVSSGHLDKQTVST
ncbi:MAG: double-strand break repair helicase AddA [Rhodomicrobiaceae bacterium]